MNRSLVIILVPALLVAAGYIFILRRMGIAPGYPPLILVMVLLLAAIYGLAPRVKQKNQDSRRLAHHASGMVITEIFNSIQGEGTRAGLPCIFVRFTGCNLRCTWCDTAYAFHGGKKMSVEEVLSRVDGLAPRQGRKMPPSSWWN